MARGYILSEQDVIALRRLAERVRHGEANRPPPTYPHDRDDYLTPEHYIIRVPAGGLPGRTDGAVTVGSDTSQAGTVTGRKCEVYKSVEGTLYPVGKSIRVYNLDEQEIRGPAFARATRDKFGTWWASTGAEDADEVIGTGTGTGTAAVCPFTVVTNVCLYRSGTGTGTSGTILGITVEYSTYDMDACPPRLMSRTCVDDPTDCCVAITPGWYCADIGDGCEPLYLTEMDGYDPAITICSGPYPSLAATQAACGVPPEPITYPCSGSPTVTSGVFSAQTGEAACLDVLVGTPPNNTITCEGNITVSLACTGGFYALTVTGGIAGSITATLISASPTELVYYFDVPAGMLSTGGSGGTTVLTLTGTFP